MRQNRPSFLIIGAAKCGTSTLREILSKHPEVGMPSREIHYFSKHFVRGDLWYLNQFKEPERVQGEKSPSYLYDPRCHGRIKGLLPDVRMIVMLRNPVYRAWSNWNMRYNDRRLIRYGLQYNQRRPKKHWLEALDLGTLTDHYLACGNRTEDLFQKPLDIIHRGRYAEQIEHLLGHFSRENLLVLISERFFADQKQGLALVCRFLNLPDFDPGPVDRVNAGVYRQVLDENIRRKLVAFYRPHNDRLFDFLGYRVEEWEDEGGWTDGIQG